MNDMDDFVERWRDMLRQMIDTAAEVMTAEAEGGKKIRAVAVMPMDEGEWEAYLAEQKYTEPVKGMLS